MELSYMDTMYLQPKHNRVGLLGGTFNPVHNGHISMAYIALYEFLLGEIIFIPLGIPPHKQYENIALAEHRLNMLHLAISGENRFSVDAIEINREGITYTVDTLEALCSAHPNTEYFYIIGADTLYELTTWKNYQRVFALASFICVLRPGINDAAVNQYAYSLSDKFGCRIYLAHDKGPDISSTLIRKLASEGHLYSELLPNSVAKYIRQNRIYIKED